MTIRRPLNDQLYDLPGAVGRPLMPALLPPVRAFGWAQNRKEWQEFGRLLLAKKSFAAYAACRHFLKDLECIKSSLTAKVVCFCPLPKFLLVAQVNNCEVLQRRVLPKQQFEGRSRFREFAWG
ncbi:MAG TPA: hypothetical protein VIC84_16245 [Blastocatellia bacterium]|jgi:hypothetical protein